MRLLITGASGFVSRHLIEHLSVVEPDAEVLGVSRSLPAFMPPAGHRPRCTFQALDLLDRNGVAEALRAFRPDCIVHLAALSSVGASWKAPTDSFVNNTNIFLNVIDAVRVLGLRSRVLSVGSSEEYGDVAPEALPLREDTPVRPVSPYAVARVSQEMLSRVYVRGYGLDIVMTRSFNHLGPYQRDAFVVPSLAKQLVAIRRGAAPPRLRTGDRSIVRDFVDVRDVVRAYHALLLRGEAGEIYNVCTNRATSIAEIIEVMQRMLDTDATLETDEALIRPSDNRIIVGSNEKIRAATGWAPEIPLQDSLESVLQWWSRQ